MILPSGWNGLFIFAINSSSMARLHMGCNLTIEGEFPRNAKRGAKMNRSMAILVGLRYHRSRGVSNSSMGREALQNS